VKAAAAPAASPAGRPAAAEGVQFVPHRDSPLEALRRMRDRWLADGRFQRWAAACWLTRPLARARSRALFDLCAGFVYSQVLFACVSLGLLRRLLERPQTPAELAQALAIPFDRLERLLGAAAALDLVQRRGAGRIGLAAQGAALLANPGVEAMVRHHAVFYADLADPVALLRQPGRATGLAAFWGYAAAADPAALSREQVAPYSRLMSASQQFVADIVLAAYPFGRHRRLLDVGGGDGSFARAAARRCPGLRVEVFDLPEVARQARERLDADGLSNRSAAWPGDFFVDPLPPGADLITLVRVVHDHDEDRVRALLRSVRRAMRRDSVLLIAEPVAGSRGAAPICDGYFGMYLMAMGSGRARSRRELQDLLQSCGFVSVRWLRTHNPLLAGVVTARRGGA
jgi:demethylspheroidene O-methyltransferase